VQAKALPTDRGLERWLASLVSTYQDPKAKTKHRRHSILTRLPRPTQAFGLAIGNQHRLVIAVLITHRRSQPNALTRAVRFDDVAHLAANAGLIDGWLGTERFSREKWIRDLPVAMSEESVGSRAAIFLSDNARGTAPDIGPGEFFVGSQGSLQTTPPATLWIVHIRRPFPEPQRFLASLERAIVRKPSRSIPQTAVEGAAQPEKVRAWAAYAEPSIWFGEPPYTPVEERIVGVRRPIRWQTERRVVARRTIGAVDVLAYQTGLFAALADENSTARDVLNQVFAALHRSGTPSLAVFEEEMIEISDFDPASGAIRGSSNAVIPRNWEDTPFLTPIFHHELLALPDSAAQQVLDVADVCQRDSHIAVASLRLAHAETSLRRGQTTEAFIMAWSLIESHYSRVFEDTWLRFGRSRSDIKKMDWASSQEIDMLIATGALTVTVGADIHRLRKLRNNLVHRLQNATRAQANECLKAARAALDLPATSAPLSPSRVLL
jgi:hypothetical protein